MTKEHEKPRRVLVLGGNHAQVPYIKELKKRGFWVALTDLNENAPGRAYTDAFKKVGYEDVPKLLDFAEQLKFSSKDKVFTAAAQFAHIGAATIAAKYEISYPSVSVIETCLDKTLFYSEFQKHSIPIPETVVVKTAEELKKYEGHMDPLSHYYLKSDFSKNPKYIYRFRGNACSPSDYFWGFDRHLRNAYVLQKEFFGRHLRLNLMPGRAVFYDFSTNAQLAKAESDEILRDHDLIEKLVAFLNYNQLQSWLVKFDIIVNKQSWCALDIGLDPPSRMFHSITSNGYNFASHYLDQYLEGDVTYPEVRL